MANKLDTFKAGIIAGVIGPFIGFVLYGLYFGFKYNKDLYFFTTEAFIGTKYYQSPIATLSLLFNLGLFFLCLKLDWEKAAKGVLGATMLYAPVIIYLFFY